MPTGIDPDGLPSEAALVRDPDQWPLWPRLPMKRYGPDIPGGFTTGYLLDTGTPEPVTVWSGTVYVPHDPDADAIVFATIDDLLGAGWEVD